MRTARTPAPVVVRGGDAVPYGAAHDEMLGAETLRLAIETGAGATRPPLADAGPARLTHAPEDPVYHAAPPPPPPPRPLDPVDLARAVLEQAEQALDAAREWMDQACLAFMVSDGFVRNGLRYGGYAREDPAREAVEVTARHAIGEYHEAWQAVVQAQQQLQQLERQHRRGHQEQWVQAHQPGLVEDLASWREALRTATSDRYHAEAKKNLALALQAYETAVAQAPVSLNGVPHA